MKSEQKFFCVDQTSKVPNEPWEKEDGDKFASEFGLKIKRSNSL